MLFRALLSCTALILVLLLCLNANAAPACESGPCPAERPSKPLDIMKFMREQASKHAPGGKAPKRSAQPARRSPVAAKPTALPGEAANSFAAQPASAPAPAPEVDVVTEDELNAIDRAGEAAPPETVGAAPIMQIADAEVATIVTKTQQPTPIAATPQPDVAQSDRQQVSWLQRIWSAVQNTLAALIAAVHHLIGCYASVRARGTVDRPRLCKASSIGQRRD